MTKFLKLMPDYNCFPLWKTGGEIENVDPSDLPLSNALRDALRAWANAYDKTLNHEYPPESGFGSNTKEGDFESEGKRIWNELRMQLGPNYQIAYFSSREARLLE